MKSDICYSYEIFVYSKYQMTAMLDDNEQVVVPVSPPFSMYH